MKEKINDIKQRAGDIKHRLDGAVNLFEKYYEIANDIWESMNYIIKI